MCTKAVCFYYYFDVCLVRDAHAVPLAPCGAVPALVINCCTK